MKTIIVGPRSFEAYAEVCRAMDSVGWTVTEVVSGCASGVDTLGERWAVEKHIPVRQFPADWQAYGRAAGPVRNRQMAEYAGALVVVWDGQSRGTKNMIYEATQRGLRIYVHRIDAASNGVVDHHRNDTAEDEAGRQPDE